MNKSYPLHHEDARPMYVNIPIEEYKRTAKKLLDAAAVIMDKDKEIKELKNAQRWRKFPEEKPIWGKEVLVVDDERKQYIVRFSHDMKWISWGKMNTCESNCVKFWMPLPKPPEVK